MKRFLIDCIPIYSNTLQTLKLPKIAPTSYCSISLPPFLPSSSLPHPPPLPPLSLPLSPPVASYTFFVVSDIVMILLTLRSVGGISQWSMAFKITCMILGPLTTTVKCILTYCVSHNTIFRPFVCYGLVCIHNIIHRNRRMVIGRSENGWWRCVYISILQPSTWWCIQYAKYYAIVWKWKGWLVIRNQTLGPYLEPQCALSYNHKTNPHIPLYILHRW